MTENFDKDEMNLGKIFDYSMSNQKKLKYGRLLKEK